ncbi:hypothetical protein P608_10650 [Comamonas thiooxydans]|uniref:Uncharacterized protein n=1 Tax=Comamonas thiooxydans TaxID=363952 RepID=A0A0E3CGQ6_9BURK|nr:hypothetical protein P608_10650 [Comamonas thiooxydans]KGH19760.1 hypothetical protein P607_10995 [Comamonas thiooxydans]KGH23439.1 hypothetical protein P606_12385 [Comamonas thiooxydans]
MGLPPLRPAHAFFSLLGKAGPCLAAVSTNGLAPIPADDEAALNFVMQPAPAAFRAAAPAHPHSYA